MRKAIVFLIALSLIMPALAMAKGTGGSKTEWTIGGIIEGIKVYDADESHGFILRIDFKTSKGNLKKIYVKKFTKIVNAAGKNLSANKLKAGNPVQIKYKKGKGENLIALEVMVL